MTTNEIAPTITREQDLADMFEGLTTDEIGHTVTPQQEFAVLFERMYAICNEHNWGDPFNYARSREIHMANTLGHTIATTLSGADAIDEDGECEYKATIQKTISATYNGISVQPTWEEQVTYLQNDKIGKYKNHYYARYDGSTIVEIYKMSSVKVMEYIVPRLKIKYHSTKKTKDPRLGGNISQQYIKENSVRIQL